MDESDWQKIVGLVALMEETLSYEKQSRDAAALSQSTLAVLRIEFAEWLRSLPQEKLTSLMERHPMVRELLDVGT